jgi:purine-binding chemotaxis protein CheW
MARETRQGAFRTVVFLLDGQRYGLPAEDVREILPALRVTPLPSAPAVVEGVIDLRGALVPVLDIRSRFRLPPKPRHFRDHLVVAETGDRTVAIRTDRAFGLVALPSDALEDLSVAVPGAEHVKGVARLPDGLVLIHDLRTFLTQAEATSLDEALRTLSDGEGEP